ncbi:hypothetical protein [Emcibacter sp.]|uniref:hypothetical protein n=1 Tax=Emcibacter sp. TaxID=1979954 RepID=UPI003A958F25
MEDDELTELSAAELRAILEAGVEVYGEKKIVKARQAMEAYNKRVTGKWVKALAVKIAVSLSIIGILVAIYYFP